jgi:hypothetical protein
LPAYADIPTGKRAVAILIQTGDVVNVVEAAFRICGEAGLGG